MTRSRVALLSGSLVLLLSACAPSAFPLSFMSFSDAFPACPETSAAAPSATAARGVRNELDLPERPSLQISTPPEPIVPETRTSS